MSFSDFLYLRRITSVENKASHPLASALVSYARLNGVEPSEDVNDFEVLAGEGVSAVVDGRTVQIGNARMAARFGWDTGILIYKSSTGLRRYGDLTPMTYIALAYRRCMLSS